MVSLHVLDFPTPQEALGQGLRKEMMAGEMGGMSSEKYSLFPDLSSSL